MFTNLSGSLPFLEAELDYRRNRLLAEADGRRAGRAVGPRRRRALHVPTFARRPKGVATAH
jgi:hypothetical protein